MSCNVLKRMVSGLLAVSLLAVYPVGMVTSFAADQYNIVFDPANTEMTTIIEGDKVNAKAKLPPNHKFSKPPFIIKRGETDVSEQELITIAQNNDLSYTIQGNAGAAGSGIGVSGVSELTYSLEPRLNANLTDGNGMLEVEADDTHNPPVIGSFYSTSIKSAPALPIQVAVNSFSFTTTSTETNGNLSFSTVSNGTGYFAGWNSQVTLNGAVKPAPGGKTLKVDISTAETSYTFEILVSMPAGIPITRGSTFTVNYRLGVINPLQLQVVTPQWAVNQIADSIRDNSTVPGIPDSSKYAYINLAQGDTLSSVTTDFTVLSLVSRYNTTTPNIPHIIWKWVPDPYTAINKRVVQFGVDGRQTQSVTLNPLQDDVKGKLVAEVEYTPKITGLHKATSPPVEIAITILGTGTPPRVEAMTETIGSNPPIDIPNKKLPNIMDAYKGNIPPGASGITPPTKPHTVNATMLFGTGRGRAEHAIIWAESRTGGAADALRVFVDSSSIPHPLDGKTIIPNTDQAAGQKQIAIQAVKQGSILLHFDYYVKDRAGKLALDTVNSEAYIIEVKDTTPSSFAQLASLQLQSPQLEALPDLSALYPNGVISYGFKSDTFQYINIELPNVVSQLNITPTIMANRGINGRVDYDITTAGGVPIVGHVETGNTIGPIDMFVESPRIATFNLTAQDGTPQPYILTINRMPPDKDSSLKTLTVVNEKDGAILQGFNPAQLEYTVTVPYATRWAKVAAEPKSPWAAKPLFTPELVKRKTIPLSGDEWLKLNYPNDPFTDADGTYNNGISPITTLSIKVQAQDRTLTPGTNPVPVYSTTYKVHIIRQEPSRNTLAASLTVKDQKNREVVFDNEGKFDKDTREYYMHFPYSADKLTFSILPEDKVANSVLLTSPNAAEGTQEKPYNGEGKPITFEVGSKYVDHPTGLTVSFQVRAESWETTKPDPGYIVHLVRNAPDQDNLLGSLEVRDQNDAPVKTFSFNPQTTMYDFKVPFNTDTLKVIPKPRSELARVTVKEGVSGEEKEINALMPSFISLIKEGETKSLVVRVYAEDVTMAPREYMLVVTRELASTDARLKNLTVTGGGPLSPKFAPNTTIYSVELPEGTPSMTFTPETAHPGATVTINGFDVKSGSPSDPYEPLDAKSVVTIVVTAQDGKTKMTYVVNVTNLNLMPKSNNADLDSLEVREGSMSPRFKPGIVDYEVAVKDDVASVDILPIPHDEGATIKVKSGTKLLGDYYDRYSSAIWDGQNDFTVEVTSEDLKVTKTYNIAVYKKDEEKQGSYKPITADMVDYTSNPIVVDISKYTVIAADVWNTLKEDYPEKTMIFQGNDYSLQITGKDMNQLVPHAAIYDLGLSFTTPDEDDIWDVILREPRNDGIEPVFIYFKNHGVLPGRMLFTVSLGREYRTQNSTWNYYNEERDRIDYYGGVRTNSRGTFTVPITHMCTYIYCEDRIAGAEIKSGELGNIGDYTGGISSGKPNPNTGAGEKAASMPAAIPAKPDTAQNPKKKDDAK